MSRSWRNGRPRRSSTMAAGRRRAEPRFQNGECGIFIGSSATRADIKANSKFDVGYGMMPYWPDVAGAPQNTIIGGATLWVLRDRPKAEYKGVAKFFSFLSKPEVQAAWHQNTGYLPITRAAFDLTRAQGFYERNPGASISIEQITLKPPTENSHGHPARLLRADPRRDRRRAGAGVCRQEIRAGRDRFRGRARQPAVAPVRAREPGPVDRGTAMSSLRGARATKQSISPRGSMDCFAEPVIGRAFARPVGCVPSMNDSLEVEVLYPA